MTITKAWGLVGPDGVSPNHIYPTKPWAESIKQAHDSHLKKGQESRIWVDRVVVLTKRQYEEIIDG